MKKNIAAVMSYGLLFFLCSCDTASNVTDNSAKKDKLDLDHNAADQMIQTEINFDASYLLKLEDNIVARFPKSNNELAFDVYQKLAVGDDNITFSPFSISAALALAYAGTKDETEAAFQNVLHFGSNASEFHKACGDFALLIANKDRSQSNTTLKVANALWLQKGFSIEDNFKNILADAYKALPIQLDFKAQPGLATATINQTISRQTHGEIDPLLKEDLSPDTRLVLTNALYFQSIWASPFSEFTRSGSFTLKDNSTKQVRYMKQVDYFPYGEDDQKQYLLMPYQDRDFGALFVLSKTGQAQGMHSLGTESFDRMLSSLSDAIIDLRLPKFSQRMSPNVKNVLIELGLGIAFDRGRANFKRISDEDLYIEDIVHEAVVKMHEGGTTAAAATAIETGGAGAGPGSSSRPEKIINFFAIRPFSFYIIHRPSGAILFMGRVNDPSNDEV